MDILIKQGQIPGSKGNQLKTADILIEKGKIKKIGCLAKSSAGQTINAAGKVILPGLFDMHVHLRQPGREDKETVKSGTKAAASGGFLAVLAMPNTEPAIDSAKAVKAAQKIIKQDALVPVYLSAAITKGRQGKELTEIEAIADAGAIAITDDGDSVDDNRLMLKAFQRAKKSKIKVICHCQDRSLSRGGVLNLGFVSTCLGLRGISKESEYARVERDIGLAEKAGADVHIAHVSCRESVEIIAKAKKRGVGVSAETAPHYFSLTDELLWDFDTNKKINPPLRGPEDVLAIKQGLADKTIDVIASDHAPHTENEKDIEFERAEFGSIGLETSLAVAFSQLVKPGILTWQELIEKFLVNPFRILGLKRKEIKPGQPADIIIFDPQKEWIVAKNRFYSKSKNSCFLGEKIKGKVEQVFYQGNNLI